MKKIRIFALLIALVLVFGGCSASNDLAYDSKYESMDGFWIEESESNSAVSPESPMEMMPEIEAETDYVTDDSLLDNSTSSSVSESKPAGNRKLIRKFNLDVETLEFDKFVSDLKNEVNSLGGYIESSSVSGNSYNYTYNRSANFTCRIPSEKLDLFINTINGLGNITYSYEDVSDITLTYVDTEARIKSLQTEYDRLIELLAEAENIDSIILLQQRISDVSYELESYQSQLRTYDNLVDYSTVYLNLMEVKRVTPSEPKTVWERISADFGDNIYDIWVDTQDFFVWFIASIPYFIIWAIVFAGIVFVVKRCLRNNTKWQERKAARKARKEYKKAQKLAEKEKTENIENEEK